MVKVDMKLLGSVQANRSIRTRFNSNSLEFCPIQSEPGSTPIHSSPDPGKIPCRPASLGRGRLKSQTLTDPSHDPPRSPPLLCVLRAFPLRQPSHRRHHVVHRSVEAELPRAPHLRRGSGYRVREVRQGKGRQSAERLGLPEQVWGLQALGLDREAVRDQGVEQQGRVRASVSPHAGAMDVGFEPPNSDFVPRGY